jgi:hypothetical protein
MAITINGTNGVTFPDSTLQASAAETLITDFASGDAGQPKIVLKAFNDIYSSNAVAGTTIISGFCNSSGFLQTVNASYSDINNSSFDVVAHEATTGQVVKRNGELSGQGQFAYIAAVGGTYRVSFSHFNGSSTTQEARIVVNSTQVYSISYNGTTGVTRTFDVTVNPFDRIIIQHRRTAGASNCTLYAVTFGTTGTGLLLQRG